MSNIPYSIVSSGDESFVTAFVAGHPTPLVAAKSGHPNFDAIVGALAAEAYVSPSEVIDLFDVTLAVAKKFENLSDRVQVGNGRVLFDGEEVANALTKQIVRFLDDDEDFEPLVNFFEKVMDNPQPHSREQLYTWLEQHDFTITSTGDIVAYKGVQSDGKGSFQSVHSGREVVLVDGEAHTGYVPNPIGSTVNMARSLVQHDPSVGCHVGLHVGTYEYAKSYSSRGCLLEVHVNPRDVVSVPTDCSWAKVRTCRYKIVKAINEQYTGGLVEVDGTDLDEEGWEFDA